ncbi:MAG: large conductance mechanosensitive channel protein MscL [Nocardioides sp.]
MLTGFKEFIMRGNLVELAVAFIIGGAFATVVSSFAALILAAIAKIFGSETPDMTAYTPGDLPLGVFLTATITLLILAAVIYFFVVTPYNKLQARMAQGDEPAPPSADIALLTEIRDLLAGRAGSGNVQGGGGLT